MGLFDFPALIEFDEGEVVRGVAVDFIGGGEDEDGFGADLPGGFEEVEGAVCVDAEVGEGLLCGPIVGGLGGGVDNEFDIGSELVEYFLYVFEVADIDFSGVVVFEGFFELGIGRFRR